MVRRSAVLATAISLGTCALAAPKASAEDLVVPFEANIQGACTLNLVAPGILARDFGYAHAMAAGFEGGQLAQVEADCNTPAMISASAPVQTSGPQLNPMVADVYLVGGANYGPIDVEVQPGLNSLEVDMYIENDAPIASGDYGFEVTLTAAPN